MGTLILLRHGRSTANDLGVLAGRSDGVDLDETGVRQAADLARRFAGARIDEIVSSPLLRCWRTVRPLADALGLAIQVDDRVTEVDYGSWTGRPLAELTGEPLWRTVQQHPAAAVFPGGEALAAVSARAVQAARDHAGQSGDDDAGGAVLLCSHGDVIKAILADALGMHLDAFQRLVVSPASVSVVRYGPLRTFVERVNDTGSLRGVGVAPPAGVDGRASAMPGGAGVATVGGDPGLAGLPDGAAPGVGGNVP